MKFIKETQKDLDELEKERLIREAAEVDDSEMYEVDDPPTEAEKAFAEELKEMIEDLFKKEDLNESFKNRSRLLDHYNRHCIASDRSKRSRRSNVYYDFRDVGLYMHYEQYIRDLSSSHDMSQHSLLKVEDIIKAFSKLFEGNKSLLFFPECGFISTNNQPIYVKFHSWANEVTTNYNSNTIDFMMYDGRYTKTLFPLDANYLENKFNNLVTRWNTQYNVPFNINH